MNIGGHTRMQLCRNFAELAGNFVQCPVSKERKCSEIRVVVRQRIEVVIHGKIGRELPRTGQSKQAHLSISAMSLHTAARLAARSVRRSLPRPALNSPRHASTQGTPRPVLSSYSHHPTQRPSPSPLPPTSPEQNTPEHQSPSTPTPPTSPNVSQNSFISFPSSTTSSLSTSPPPLSSPFSLFSVTTANASSRVSWISVVQTTPNARNASKSSTIC